MRLYKPEDSSQLYSVVTENLDRLHDYIAWAKSDYTLQTSAQFISRSRIEADEGRSLSLGIFRGGELAGSAGFVKFVHHSKRAEIGYWVAKKFEGKGIITNSCRTLITHGFEELELNRIEIRCAVDNTRSRHIPERLGFSLEGIIRQGEWRHTRYHDMAVYGLLRCEWNSQDR